MKKKNLKALLTILLFITTMISAFSQEEYRRKYFVGIDYTGSISLAKSAVHQNFSLYYLRFLKEQKYYAMVDFFGNKFFQQERRSYSHIRVTNAGAFGGVKCIGGKNLNLYADAGGRLCLQCSPRI